MYRIGKEEITREDIISALNEKAKEIYAAKEEEYGEEWEYDRNKYEYQGYKIRYVEMGA